MPAATTEQVATSLASTNVVIHPLVLLSVVDHWDRAGLQAKGSKKRVVGILLGQDEGNVINAANSYAVPFEEDERQPNVWFLDHNYIEEMAGMFKKINSREKVIGWYHTGPRLRASDLAINDVVKRYCARPVMVIVDVNRRGDLPTDGYIAVEEIKDDGTATQKTFMHVSTSIEAEESEEIGVEHLLRNVKDLSTGTLSSRVTDRLSSLRGLERRLREIRDYLELVVSGEMAVNHQIIGNLQDVFNLLPGLEMEERNRPVQGDAGGDEEGAVAAGGGERPFTVTTNDELLIMYLSSLVRAIIALHSLIDNKLENQAAAIEEAMGGKDEKKGEKDKDGKEKDAKDEKEKK